MLYYNRKWCKVYYLEDIPCVCLEWNGFTQGRYFREACNAALQLLKEKQANKMLADNRRGKIVSLEDQRWLTDEWFTEAYNAGYRTSAVVESENLFNEVTVKNIVNQMEGGKFTAQYFQNIDKAKQWLKDFKD